MKRTAIAILFSAQVFVSACFGGPEPTDGVYEFVSLNGVALPTQPEQGCCIWRRGVMVLDGADWEMSLALARPPQTAGDRVKERDLEFVGAKYGEFVISGPGLELVEQFDNAPDIHLVTPVIEADTIRMTILQDLTWGVQEYRAVFVRAASQNGRGTVDCWRGAVVPCPD